MADAQTRAALEATQVDLRRLKRELEQWPEVSEERAQLTEEAAGFEVVVQSLQAQVLRHQARETSARDELDRRSSGNPWWRSPTATGGAVALAAVGSMVLAAHALDWFNWTLWAPRFAVPLLVLPPLVNGLRALRGWHRRRLSRR